MILVNLFSKNLMAFQKLLGSIIGNQYCRLDPRVSQNMSNNQRGKDKGQTQTAQNSIMSTTSSTQSTPAKIVTAGIIVIGNEILKGQVRDTNSHFLTSGLYDLGVKVEKISVIPDDIDTIASEVSKLSNQFTHVITSGGIGPTHDDVTFEGVARAFGEKLERHPAIASFITEWFKTDDPNSPAMKMADIPKSSVLHFGESKGTGTKLRFPVVKVRNVTIFPGIPHLLEKKFALLGKELFQSNGTEFHSCQLYLSADEVTFAKTLSEAVSRFKQVTFGSYPELFHSYYKTKLTMDSLDKSSMERARQYLETHLDKGHYVDYIEDPITNPYPYITALIAAQPDSILPGTLKENIEFAIDTLEQCFTKYKPEEICLCYNGGKDCLAVLHLAFAVMKSQHPDKRLQAVYIPESQPFPQVTEFVQQTIKRYDLDCEIIEGSMKRSLETLLHKRSSIKAVIMGTRSTDPHAEKLNSFTRTDGDWPQMMRVNPLINWDYSHIWAFIRGLYLPYCSLYDKGYTSIGGENNTLPNPFLQSKDSLGRLTYLPAHTLQQMQFERKGRTTSL